MTVAVIIVAAGRGRRLGGQTPKQYLALDGACSLRRAAEVFLALDEIVWLLPIIHPDDADLCQDALGDLSDPRLMAAEPGGDSRAASVRAGLERLVSHAPSRVLIHDAARPFVTDRIIRDVIAELGHADGAAAALPVVDALWQSEGNAATTPVPRDGIWRAQTPQGFDFAKILAAHRAHDGTGTDDIAVARAAGMSVRLVEGAEENFKITTAADLARALDVIKR